MCGIVAGLQSYAPQTGNEWDRRVGTPHVFAVAMHTTILQLIEMAVC